MSVTSSPSPQHSRVVIIGSGPAGYTAGIYAARAMMEPVLISGFEPGGQLMITSDVENYPGFTDPVQGPWLMEQLRTQAERVGTRMISDHVTSVDLSRRPFAITCDSGAHITCDAMIIATGAKARWLDLPSEQKFRGFGVSACATCDGFFFRGKDVVVVGGGNTAIEEALYLAHLAKSVTLVHRRDSFRAEKILQNRVFANPKIRVIWNHAIDEVLGDESPPGVHAVRLRDVMSGATRTVQTDGLFVAIGHQPASELFAGQLTLKAGGYIQTAPDSTATNVPGVFAAGDVTDDVYRQAVTAAGMGCMAALEAERWLGQKTMPAIAAE